jgi:hypothetical protein
MGLTPAVSSQSEEHPSEVAEMAIDVREQRLPGEARVELHLDLDRDRLLERSRRPNRMFSSAPSASSFR